MSTPKCYGIMTLRRSLLHSSSPTVITYFLWFNNIVVYYFQTIVFRKCNNTREARTQVESELYRCGADIGRASHARENEAGGSWGQDVHILYVYDYVFGCNNRTVPV